MCFDPTECIWMGLTAQHTLNNISTWINREGSLEYLKLVRKKKWHWAFQNCFDEIVISSAISAILLHKVSKLRILKFFLS